MAVAGMPGSGAALPQAIPIVDDADEARTAPVNLDVGLPNVNMCPARSGCLPVICTVQTISACGVPVDEAASPELGEVSPNTAAIRQDRAV